MNTSFSESRAGELEQAARVVALAENGRALVEAAHGCGRCHEADGCGKVHLTRIFGTARRFLAQNPVGAKPGDEVIILVPDGSLFTHSVLVYLWPLAALLAGALAGKFLANDLGALAGGVLAFVAALMITPKIWARYLANPALEPKIGKVVVHFSGGKPCDWT